MTGRTVRDVLRERLQDETLHGEDLVDAIVTDLRGVLTTGGVFRAHEIAASLVVAGDVVLDKAGRAWAVTRARHEGDDAPVELELACGNEVRTPWWRPDRRVAVLLPAADARALAVVEAQLGGSLAERTPA